MTSRLLRSAALAFAGVITAAMLAACGGGDDDAAQPAAATFNEADVKFAQGMLPHHVQALEMAKLAEARSTTPAIKQLAGRILAAQEPEIAELRALLEQWGRSMDKSMENMDSMESMQGMPGMETMEGMANLENTMAGMMTADEMDQLRKAKGAAFDRLFLRLMIEHHRSAVKQAQAEETGGKDPNAVSLAKKIDTAQQGEIKKMQKLKNS